MDDFTSLAQSGLRKKYKNELSPYKDLLDMRIKGVYFSKCPLKGWFFDHWALILKREDDKYMTF